MFYRCSVGVAVLLGFLANVAFASSTTYKGYTFEAYVIKADNKRYKEFQEKNQTTLKVKANEEYSIVVRNPLPVRVAVAVSIDGLNSIDGKRTSPRNAQKWMIGPNSSLTIAGWQTSKQTLRKFLFTEQSATYAQWQEDKDGKPYSRNLGVIGVAWFWNSNELDIALHPPQPFEEEKYSRAADSAAPMAGKRSMPASAKAEADAPRAGTGMGTQQQNRVTEVVFDANVGMFSVKDVLKIFYEFAKEPPEPLPFVEDEEDDGGRFAPDMNK